MQNVATDKNSPRFYHVMLQKDLLEGWTLIREWGAQGSPGRVRRDHHMTWNDAVSALNKVRDAQIRRGFQIMFTQGEGNQSDCE